MMASEKATFNLSIFYWTLLQSFRVKIVIFFLSFFCLSIPNIDFYRNEQDQI